VLGVGAFNSLQYLALHFSTPINVTLVASSMPVWMLAVGALFLRRTRHAQQLWARRWSWRACWWCSVRGSLATPAAGAFRAG
jgi:hypothetical protein